MSGGSRRRVLVVEDSPLMQDMIGFALKGIEVDVIKAKNGLEGLEQAAIGKFDLVLTDVLMPEVGGIEFIRNLRRLPEYQAIPIVVISTQGARDAMEAGMAVGANDYLPKPFKPQQLVRIVKRYLEDSSL